MLVLVAHSLVQCGRTLVPSPQSHRSVGHSHQSHQALVCNLSSQSFDRTIWIMHLLRAPLPGVGRDAEIPSPWNLVRLPLPRPLPPLSRSRQLRASKVKGPAGPATPLATTTAGGLAETGRVPVHGENLHFSMSFRQGLLPAATDPRTASTREDLWHKAGENTEAG